MSQDPAAGFQFGRTFRGWVWLLGRDLRRIAPILLVWILVAIVLQQFDVSLGLPPGSEWVSTTLLAEPLFAGLLYVIGLSGHETRAGAALGVALNRYLALLILTVLGTLGMIVGFLFLILPGIALTVLWTIAFPILITERANPIEALAASFSRMKAVFWPALGLIAIYVFGIILCVSILGVFDAADPGSTLTFNVLDATYSAVVSTVGIYLNVAIYKELGFTGAHDVSVFD